MVKGNGFARHKVTCASPTPPVPPKDSGRFMFMIKAVLVSALLILCGQTVFSQCALVCKNSITVALGPSGTATIFPPALLQSSVGCSNNFTISVADTSGNVYGPTLGPALLGEPLTATLLHPASGNSCNVSITLIDNLPPVMDCGDTLFIWCNAPTIPDSLGFPEVSDNVTDSADIELGFIDQFIDLECFDSVGGKPVTAYIKRTWMAEDESGNMSSCIQHIFLKRALLSQVVFPKHRDGVAMPALECSVDKPDSLEFTGQPTIDGYVLDNTTSCELVVSYIDQQVPICGGARKIIRTWSVFDLCTEDFRVYAQIIRVLDTTPPAITCPANVSFNTYNTSCSAQVWLPQATATDGCSGAILQANWQYGSGYGPFNNVPKGNYTVTYTATDGCNNNSTCQITVTVKDEKKPTALCESLVNVNLEEDGTAIVFAETFDNGSYDNCGISLYQVSRNGDPFDEFVSFDCSDIGPNIQVTLKVTDGSGLTSQCTANAKIKDPVQPEIICPAPKTINCGQDYNNTALTGQPFASDNCSIATVNFLNEVNLNSCGNGTVLRTWKATDTNGNFTTCDQLITVADNTPITVTFPDDILTYECQPNTDPAVTGKPVITGKDCEQLQITNTDYFFYTAEPACFKLIRNWAVIDWCSYQPNSPNSVGFWEHTQVIEVRDSVAPVLTCPANLTVGINQNNCQAFATVPLPSVVDCSNQITFTNNSIFAQNNNGAASGTYPKGVHTITYTAADGCGNTSTCSMKLTIKDSQAPNPVCNNGVSVTIQQNGLVTVTPSMINNGSFDNCSPTAALVLQVSPNTFDCQSLGSKTVTLTVTDEAGNSAFCQTTVVVQDNFNICSNQNTATIAGKIGRENGDPLAAKLVGLTGGLSIAVHTDVDGTFAFSNLPKGQNYTLTPSYNTKPLNGVTTYDLVIIRRHILNIELLDSPYKFIAADVNRSGAVTTLDLVDLQKLILQITTSFPNNNKSWRFVPSAYVFPNPANPLSQPFPESITVEGLSFNQWDKDFVGIKIGDVNNSANPANLTGDGGEDRSFDNALIFNTKDIGLVAGEAYAIPFMAKATSPELAGFQFTFDFDENALAFEGIETGTSPVKASDFGTPDALGEGAITVSWSNFEGKKLPENEAVFTLKFRAKTNARLSEVLAINSRITPAEAYSGSFFASSVAGFEMLGVSLEFESEITKDFQLYQNTPNPFHQKTSIGFQLPEATEISLRIFDVYGKLLKTYEGSFSQGKHAIEIDLSGVPVTGILLCEMDAKGFRKKAIKMMKF
jgi:hypothetical protein